MNVNALGEANFHLHDINTVQVRYFNSRGGFGAHFSEVKLKDHELRPSRFLHKGRNALMPVTGVPGNSTVGIVYNDNTGKHNAATKSAKVIITTTTTTTTNTDNKVDTPDRHKMKKISLSEQVDKPDELDKVKQNQDLW